MIDAVRDAVWIMDADGPIAGVCRLTAEGLYAGDLPERDLTACAPDGTWVMDFTYCRTWDGIAYSAALNRELPPA